MRHAAWNRAVPLVVAVILVGTALPTLTVPANPQHVDQARALASGTPWITVPSTTHDLGRADGRWYSPFPPLPALLAVPLLVAGADPGVGLNIMVVLAAAAAVWLAGRVGRRWGGPACGAWAAVALGLGSGLWAAAVLHDTYHSAHVLAVAALLLALDLAGRRRPRAALAGLATGVAALARQATVLAAPAVAAVAALRRPRQGRLRVVVTILLAVALPLTLYLALNTARFGSPLDTGYGAISHHPRLAADVAAHGVFSLHWVPRQLAVMLGGTPRLVPTFPWLVPDPDGLAVWLMAPWLLLALRPLLAPDRPPARRVAAWCWGGTLLTSVPHLLYVNTGWVQLGYRFSLDWMPLLLLAAILGVRRAPRSWAVGLLAAAVVVNAWGMLCLATWERWSPALG